MRRILKIILTSSAPNLHVMLAANLFFYYLVLHFVPSYMQHSTHRDLPSTHQPEEMQQAEKK